MRKKTGTAENLKKSRQLNLKMNKMKKILLSSAAAVLTVLGFSSFKSMHHRLFTTYYFEVSGSSVASGTKLHNSDGTVITNPSVGCGSTPANICVVTVAVGDLTSAHNFLKTVTLGAPITYLNTLSWKD